MYSLSPVKAEIPLIIELIMLLKAVEIPETE